MCSRNVAFVLFVGALCTWLACGSASADEDSQSANYLIEACRILANGSNPRTPDETLKVGECIGVLQSLSWVGEEMADPRVQSCRPSEVTTTQLAKVVVAFLDANPDQLHQPMAGLTLLALAQAWPCKSK
jgi:Rap1a immunity proteins